MSTVHHTPEPWRVEERTDPQEVWVSSGYDPDFEIQKWEGLAVCFGSDDLVESSLGHDKALANARRIAACVNACKGISTDRLEKMIPGTLANLLTLKGSK